jgi:ATP/maltotriose-dependent transcriptional regulator MalT
LRRARLLPACVEIMLAGDDIQAARDMSRELQEIAQSFDTEVLGAIAAYARGSIEVAEGDAQAALSSLRGALRVWQQFDVPYMAARVRVLLALACRGLGDIDGCELQFAAARATFERLGAAPDLMRIDSLTSDASLDRSSGLTQRELQVLRLIAAGKTNKAIAAQLFLSCKTIDRHASNIFNKLQVGTRSAATAYAYAHKLVEMR